jgi:hypothetical protein
VSIIIVTFNSKRHIVRCLASVREAVRGLSAEICVVDNHSSDGTSAEVRARCPEARVIDADDNRGFAHGVNLGLRHTTGRYVLWLNPDSRAVGGNLADVMTWMDAHPDVAICGGRLLDPDGALQRSARTFPSYGAVLGARQSLLTKWFPGNPFSRRYLRADLTYAEIARVDWVSGACLLHRRSVSDALGGLDDGFFMYFEDVDFCYRATRAGSTVYFHPGFTVEHDIGGSSEPVRFRMLVIRHQSLWRWYTTHFKRNAVKDAAVWCGVWIRCVVFMLAALRPRRQKDAG